MSQKNFNEYETCFIQQMHDVIISTMIGHNDASIVLPMTHHIKHIMWSFAFPDPSDNIQDVIIQDHVPPGAI